MLQKVCWEDSGPLALVNAHAPTIPREFGMIISVSEEICFCFLMLDVTESWSLKLNNPDAVYL